MIAKLSAANSIRIVSNTLISPASQSVIDKFVEKHPLAKHVVYDAYSYNGLLDAAEDYLGKRFIPAYDFSKASTIVSIEADFLGTWLSPIEFAKQYSKTRKLAKSKKTMSRHYQFESIFSLTGANADYRTAIKPSEEGAVILSLYNAVAKKLGQPTLLGPTTEFKYLDKAASDLVKSKSKSLVVSGSNDKDVQALVFGLNEMLSAHGVTAQLNITSNYKKGSDTAFASLVHDMNNGNVDAIVLINCNPVYESPLGIEFKTSLSKIPFKVALAYKLDETASLCDAVIPTSHYLESWADAQPKSNVMALGQPAITPIFKTRQFEETLLTWTGTPVSYYEYLTQFWKENIYNKLATADSFESFWDKTLFDGVLILKSESQELPSFAGALNTAASSIKKPFAGKELVIYQKIGLGTGTQANNPWLQEMPDPITKACWENYLTVPVSFAKENGIKMDEGKTVMLKLTVGEISVNAPAMIQPGLKKDTFGLAMGYGRTKGGKVADGRGINAFQFVNSTDSGASFYAVDIQVEVLGNPYTIAHTQTHHTYMGRENVIQESILSEYAKNPSAGRFDTHISSYSGRKKPDAVTLWKGHEYPNHHWGLTIDLNSCIGCSACVIACQAENNVPVVGKQSVIDRREMHWIRIDRYYSSDAPDDKKDPDFSYKELEHPSDDPEVVFQPMMCQHCNNAPCETVCPVVATTHSTEGLNQMTYNRCVGTRYCANNCPYKVRRFNWFKYHDNKQFSDVNTVSNTDLGKMVLNPDVTVRSRGVMEKCSMCVQRIQAGKLQAKKEKRQVRDKDINMACASACPTDAIVFGDLNNDGSAITKILEFKKHEDGMKEIGEPRAYTVLEELRVDPNVWYFTKIRNKEAKTEA